MSWGVVCVASVMAVIFFSADVHGAGSPRLPSRAELCQSYLTADVLLPGTVAYAEARIMKNTAYDKKPAVIVKAEGAHDVKGAVRLATDNNLQLTVSSSGHDYIGRSIADNSVHIDLSGLTAVHINRSDTDSDTGASAIIQTAATWAIIYAKVHEAGYVAVGGSAHTVAPGGYIQGGGHSPMSRLYGLGVDNTLGITMVTMEGDLVYVDATGVTSLDEDSTKTYDDKGDLFWAIRGGGGGTFGVVLSYKIKIHKPPSAFTNFLMVFANSAPGLGNIGKEVVTEINEWFYENRNNNKIGGYLLTNNLPVDIPGAGVINGTVSLFSLYAGPYEEARQVYQRLYDFRPEWYPTKSFRNFSTFWDYERTVSDDTGVPVYIINRFMQPEDLRKEGLAKVLSEDLLQSDIYLGCTTVMIGGKAQDYPAASAAINPYFRSGAYSTTCATGWEDASDDKQPHIDKMQPYREAFYQYGNGVYLNEPDFNLTNWKTDYWGSMAVYDRLLDIKKKWDPHNRLWCHHCVGSDLVNPPPSGDLVDGELVTTCHEFCVDGEEIDGNVWLPGSDYYNAARELKNPYFTATPAFIVKVKTVDDIKLALKYARENNMRPAILSSGHDYIGRSTCNGCVNIDLSGMTKITINSTDTQSDTGASAVLETACNWVTVYEAVHAEGLLAVGGSAHTVAPGGYLQGGGHSPMGRFLGLGVDNILGITMVTVSGDLVYVDAEGVTSLDDPEKKFEDNGQLFWALRGGGGGTFGVVVSYKVKLHKPPPQISQFVLTTAIQNPFFGNIGKDVVQFINQWFYNNRDNNKIGGYLLTNNIPVSFPGGITINGTATLSSLYMGPLEEAKGVYEPLTNYKPEWGLITQLSSFSSFWDYEKDVIDEDGYPSYIMNRFMQPADLQNPGLATLLTDDMMKHDVIISCTSTMIGGKFRDVDDNNAAINPSFRNGLYATSCGTVWGNPDDQKESDYHIQAIKTYGESFYLYGEGVYLNEAERDLEDWKQEYWGSSGVYSKLLQAKQQWDPDNVLWCLHCVGSDLVSPPPPDNPPLPEKLTYQSFPCQRETDNTPKPDPDGTSFLAPTLFTTFMMLISSTLLS